MGIHLLETLSQFLECTDLFTDRILFTDRNLQTEFYMKFDK